METKKNREKDILQKKGQHKRIPDNSLIDKMLLKLNYYVK